MRFWRVLQWGALLTPLLVLAASLIANVLIYRQGAAEYREMKEVRLDPMGLRYDRFPPDLPAGASTEPLAVFFGDSRAQAWWPPPNVKGVIVTTIFPVGPVPLMKRPLWSSQIPDAVREVNADLQSIHDPGVILLDSFDLLQSRSRLKPAYSVDTLHLNPQGYAVLNERLRHILLRQISADSTNR